MADDTARHRGHLAPYGQPVVVENHTGAGGNIGAQYVARAAPDGYTLLLTSNSHTLNPLIYTAPGYDPQKDFTPVMEITEGPVVLVTQSTSPLKTLKDVVDAARAKPDSLSYAHGGLGLPPHIAMEMFKRAANVEITNVAYKGAGPAVQDFGWTRTACDLARRCSTSHRSWAVAPSRNQ